MMLAEWAVTSSILILIVLAVRFLFRNKLSARLNYALWAVVLVRLLVPLQVELPAAVSEPLPMLASNLAKPLEEQLVTEDERQGLVYEALIPSELVTWEDIPKGDDVYLSVFLPYDHAPLPEHMTVDEADVIYRTGVGAPVTLDGKVMSPWLIGLALSGGAMLWSNLLFSWKLRKRRRVLEDVEGPIPVYVSEGLPSPCLFGLFRPAIYVTPEAAENPGILRHVLAHELTHYAHKDHLWSLLRCLALALHWYNPLVWLAVVLSKRDGELACDEGTVARLGEGERIPYGRTLVDMVAVRSARPADLLSCSTAMTGGGKSIQQRVVQLVKHPKTVKIALFAALAMVVLAVVFVFAGRGEEEGITSSPEFDTFLTQVEAAQQINIGDTMLSSTITPSEISDPEFLAQAKELLREGRGVFNLEDDIQWEDIRMSLSATQYCDMEEPEGITQEELEKMFFRLGCPLILFTTDDRDLETACRYWLAPWEGYCLLVDWDAEREENSIEVLGSWPFNLCSQLKELARGEASGITRSTFDYNQHYNRLNSAQGVWFNLGTMLHDSRVVTDSGQLVQLRELLALKPLTKEEEAWTWDGVWDYVISFTSTPPDADWTGSEDCFYYVSMEENGQWYVLLPTERDERPSSGDFVGRIPEGNWEKVEEIYRNAPSVDDRQHAAQNILRGDLTQEQVERANEAFRPDMEIAPGEYGPSEISCFFTSSYDDPTQIDLEQFLMYCPLAETLENDEVEEFQAVMEKGKADIWDGLDRELSSPLDLPVPTHRYPREKVSALLKKYAGVTVEELDWSDCLYVEEYDAFYNFTSDFGPGFFPCAGGQVMEDTVLLWSEPNEDGNRCELTLRKSAESWLIQSFHTIYER